MRFTRPHEYQSHSEEEKRKDTRVLSCNITATQANNAQRQPAGAQRAPRKTWS